MRTIALPAVIRYGPSSAASTGVCTRRMYAIASVIPVLVWMSFRRLKMRWITSARILLGLSTLRRAKNNSLTLMMAKCAAMG